MNEHQTQTDDARGDSEIARASAQIEIDRLTAELAAASDRQLRAQAEAENVRKRMRREMDDVLRYAALPVLKDMLAVLDDIDRALAAAQNSSDQALVQGITLLRTRMLEALERHGCCRIEAEGAEFDPAQHEAMMMQPSADQPPSTVLHVAQPGYTLHERVIRPAKVIVAKSPGDA
jgi:molecular chaperone GrpE